MPLINKPPSDNSSKSMDEEFEELSETINVLQLFLRDYVIDVNILEVLHKERLENDAFRDAPNTNDLQQRRRQLHLQRLLKISNQQPR